MKSTAFSRYMKLQKEKEEALFVLEDGDQIALDTIYDLVGIEEDKRQIWMDA